MKKILLKSIVISTLLFYSSNLKAANIHNAEDFSNWLCNGEVNCVSYDDNLIKLQKNISLSYNDNNVANIMNNITLDLNGYTIENISDNLTNSYFINIDTEKFTIEDSSDSKNGKITTNMRGIANVQSGALYINGGTFNAIRESAYAFGIANGKLYFNNGTINSNNVGIHMFGSNSYLEMNNGKIYADSSGIYTTGCMLDNFCNNNENISININNGVISNKSNSILLSADIGNVFLNISGGFFEGKLSIWDMNDSINAQLSGGEFHSDDGGAIEIYNEEKIIEKSKLLNMIADGFIISPSNISNGYKIIDDVEVYSISTDNSVKIIKNDNASLDNNKNTEDDVNFDDEIKNPKTNDLTLLILLISIVFGCIITLLVENKYEKKY